MPVAALHGESRPALLVERVEAEQQGVDIRLRVEGLAGLVRDLGASSRAEQLAA